MEIESPMVPPLVQGMSSEPGPGSMSEAGTSWAGLIAVQRAQCSRGCNSWRRRRRTHPPRPSGWRAGWMQSKPMALFPSHLILSLRCPSPSKPTRLTSGTLSHRQPEQHWHLPGRPAQGSAQGYRSRNLCCSATAAHGGPGTLAAWGDCCSGGRARTVTRDAEGAIPASASRVLLLRVQPAERLLPP